MASIPGRAAGGGVSVGRVLGRAFGVLADNPLVMFGVAFLFAALPNGVIGYVVDGYRTALTAQPDGFRDIVFLSVGVGLIILVLTMVVQGALVRATVAYAAGRTASFGESVTAGLRVAVPLIALAVVFAAAMLLGFLLLVVPGVILYTIWSVSSPALVEERVGVFGALARSAALTKGARWKVFALNLVVLVAIWLVSASVGIAEITLRGGVAVTQVTAATSPVMLALSAVVTTLVTAFWAAAQTALYVELRDWKEGPQQAQLEDVFA